MIPAGGTAAKPGAAARSRDSRLPASQRARRWAGALLIITSVLWLHEWFPALFGVAFVVWVLLHNRLEGELGNDLLRRWRRVWPPVPLVLIPLLVAGTVAYWLTDQPLSRKILPLALNLGGLSLVLVGGWERSWLSPVWVRPLGKEPSTTP
ncbi:MAG: hypothetical protein ACREJ9_09125 [Candidatus Rokuibacteriota bacterium]